MIDNSIAVCTVNIVSTEQCSIQIMYSQDSENGFDYGTIVTSSGSTILNCKNVSGTGTLVHDCDIGTTSLLIKYSKDSSGSNNTDTFKFKIEPIVTSYPEVDYDAYITNTDDFEDFKNTENVPVNTTVVTYNDRGLSGTGYCKQEDGTWKQIGIYNDIYSIPSNIVRGKVVNGVTGSYIDVSSYNNLYMDGTNIRRNDTSCYTQFGSVDMTNIFMDVNNKVYCDIGPQHYGFTMYCKSAIDNSINIEIPADAKQEHVYLGTCDVITFNNSMLLSDIELTYEEMSYTVMGGETIRDTYVTELKLYKSNIGNIIKYTAVIPNDYTIELKYSTSNGAAITTIQNTTDMIQLSSNCLGDITITYLKAYNTKQVDMTYYADDDTTQSVPFTIKQLKATNVYNEDTKVYTKQTVLICTFNNISMDMDTQYLQYNIEIKTGDTTLYTKKILIENPSMDYDITINGAYNWEDLTINVLSAAIKTKTEFQFTYILKDVDGNDLTPEDYQELSNHAWFTNTCWPSISDRYDTSSTPVKRVITFYNNAIPQYVSWVNNSRWEAYTYITLTDEQLETGTLEVELKLPISKTKCIGYFCIYSKDIQRSSESPFANIVLKDVLINRDTETVITDFRQFGDYWYMVSDEPITIYNREKTDITFPDEYTNTYKGPFVLPSKDSVQTLSSGYSGNDIMYKIYKPNNAYVYSIYIRPEDDNNIHNKYKVQVYNGDTLLINTVVQESSSAFIQQQFPIGTVLTMKFAKLDSSYNVTSGWLTETYTIPEDKLYKDVYLSYESLYLEEHIPNN